MQGKSRVILFSRIIGVCPMVSRILFLISILRSYKGLGSTALSAMSGHFLFHLKELIQQDEGKDYGETGENKHDGVVHKFFRVQFCRVYGKAEMTGRGRIPVHAFCDVNE